MLKSVLIERFKNIEKVKIELGRINIIIGANNAGKSSILQAIQFGVSVAQTTTFEKNVEWKLEKSKRHQAIIDSIVKNDKKIRGNTLVTSVAAQQLVYSPLRDVSALALNGRLRRDENKGIVITFEELESENICKVIVTSGHNKNIAINVFGRDLGEKLKLIEEPYSIFVTGLAGIPNAEEFKTAGIVRKAAARGDSNNVFRNILLLLSEDTDGWEQFLIDFNDIFPEIKLDIKFNPDNDEFISANIKVKDNTLPIDASGTGVLQAIQILAYINVYKPKLLILDEPDSHLHPDNQRKLARLLLKVLNKRSIQIILATHSRHLVDELKYDAKIHWIRNGEIFEEKFDNIDILMDIGALDKGELILSGKVRCVILTEDEDVKPIKVIAESSGFKMEEVEIWSYKGCTKLNVALGVADFIRNISPTTRILIHRDRDYLYDEEIEKYINNIKKHQIDCFVTDGTDCESHFLNPLHIIKLYNSITLDRAKELISEATNDNEKKSIDKFTNSRENIELQKLRDGDREKKAKASELSNEARQKYGDNEIQYRHGKLVLRLLSNKIQREIGGNINLLNSSDEVSNKYLKKIASEIWGIDSK